MGGSRSEGRKKASHMNLLVMPYTSAACKYLPASERCSLWNLHLLCLSSKCCMSVFACFSRPCLMLQSMSQAERGRSPVCPAAHNAAAPASCCTHGVILQLPVAACCGLSQSSAPHLLFGCRLAPTVLDPAPKWQCNPLPFACIE